MHEEILKKTQHTIVIVFNQVLTKNCDTQYSDLLHQKLNTITPNYIQNRQFIAALHSPNLHAKHQYAMYVDVYKCNFNKFSTDPGHNAKM